MRPLLSLAFALSALFAGLGAASAQSSQPKAAACPAPRLMTFQIAQKFTRDVVGFTEGLEVHKGELYESTGSLGGGTRIMRIVPSGPSQGRVTVLNDAGQKFFGEGLTFLGGSAYQLSWQDRLVFVYDQNFKLTRTMRNPREGWGLTNDGRYLIFGDGSDRIFYADPKDFAIKGSIQVRRGARAVDDINELEYVAGKIYANVWMTRSLVRIDAKTGCIEAEAQLDNLYAAMTKAERDYAASDSNFVLNGIAYDAQNKLFTLMGKEWPMVFTGRFEDR